MNVDDATHKAMYHRGAFDVPPWPSLAPWAWPGWFPWLGAFPQRKISWVLLSCVRSHSIATP